MNEEMVDKVARAMHEGALEHFKAYPQLGGVNKSFDEQTPLVRERYTYAARAAIRAVKDWYFAGRVTTLKAECVVVLDDAEADVPLTAFSAEEKEAFREQLPVPEADGTVDRMYSDLGGCD